MMTPKDCLVVNKKLKNARSSKEEVSILLYSNQHRKPPTVRL